MDGTLHILMLEDQPADAALIQDELRRSGLEFDAKRIETRDDFLQEIERRKPDIILSDHGLPAFDGLSALTLARKKCPDVPFVFVTGAIGEEFAIRIFENGATDYVLKHHMDELAPAIRRAIRRAQRERLSHERIERLERDAEFYRLLVYSVRDYALYMVDAEGRVLTWNTGAQLIDGYTAEEAIGKRLDELFPADLTPARLRETLAAAERDGRIEIECWRTRRDSSPYWANVALTAIRDQHGALRGFVRVARDLTERRQAMDAMGRSELRTRAIIETALDAVVLMDTNGIVHEWNAAAEKMFGRQREHALGKKMSELIVPPYLRPAHERGMARYLAEGKATILGQRFETFAQRADGTEFQVELAVAEIPTDGARMFAGYISDITERKRAEEELKRFSQELEQRVAQRTEQLEAANKELEAFSYSVSHDLRAPLRHINGFVELLQSSAGELLQKGDRELLDTIADSARHMGKLIDDLLSFSRMGRAELRFVPVKLENLAQEALRELRHEIHGRDVAVEMKPLPTVEGDPVMLRQVFINLISNALKYSRNRKDARIEIFAQESPGEHVIAVRDNGVGFDAAYAHKLFGVFQRLHSPQEFEGTGIGLAIVRRVVARHDGRVWAEGEVDKGATFYFALPIRAAEKEADV